MNKLRGLGIAVLLLLGFSMWVPVVGGTTVYAATGSKGEVCDALGDIGPGGRSCNNDGGNTSPNSLIRLAIRYLSIVAGIIAVIMLIVGGLKFITSQGDSASMSSAKKTIIYALVGLVLVVMAQFIVRFVLGEAY